METTDDEDDRLYDDGSEFELFQGDHEDEGDENFHGEGGWIKDDDNNCNSSPMSSEFSGIKQLLTEIEHMHERSSSENLNSTDVYEKTQMGNNTKDVSDNVVDNSLSQPSSDNRYVSLIPKAVNLVDLDPTFLTQFHEPTTQNTSPSLDLPVGPHYKPNIQNPTEPSNPHFKPNEPCKVYAHNKQHKKKLHSSASTPTVTLTTTKKQTKFSSLKLIDSMNGIHPTARKAKNLKLSGSSSKPNTPSVSYSCNDSFVVRCNNRIINSEPTHSNESVNEVIKTIEVGSILGYNLAGREVDVSNIIKNTGDNIDNHLNFIGTQESKTDKVDTNLIHSLWGNQRCEFACKLANGSSGGIIAIWIKIGVVCLMIEVYAPQDLKKKITLWNTISNLILSHQEMAIVLSDFNEVRCQNERLGTVFCNKGAKLFNDFIYNCDLVDLPMGGRKFTRMNKYGTKLSKIDRILVTQHFVSMWPNAQLTALPSDLSDHCPIIIKTHHADFGLIPFKFYNSWLLNDELGTIISHSWSAPVNCHPGYHFEILDLLQKAKIKWAIEGDENTILPCGKSPGPDGFTFKFIKHYWEIIGSEFIEMVKRFEIEVFLPRGSNSSFIALVPKCEDPLHIKDFRPISLIGCQYKVIAKLLANKLLQVVGSVMGFSQKWRKWINGCLGSAYSSVLVNGSPTKEFKIEKGLRQGDPLSPFLFIIAMEALHVRLEDAKLKNIFEGVKVGSNDIDISHLQFAHDALIMGKWSIDNAKNLCRILRCFHLASGLKPIIDKFHNRLTSGKAKSLSPGGRLTLLKSALGALGTYCFSIFQAPKCVLNYLEQLRRNFFWGGTMENNKIAWIAWKKVCSELKFGGLGIGSLNASNISMLVKWWWRLYTDRNALWFQVIVSIHGINGGIDLEETSLNRLPPSPWKNILSLNRNLLKTNIDLHVIFKKRSAMAVSSDFGTTYDLAVIG
nr:RNA-directed DNA polymerase, eukaryota [Tanacetum cinerariifolium]